MSDKKNKYVKFLILLLVPIAIWYSIFMHEKSIKKNQCFSVARIVKLTKGFKGNYSYTYEFLDRNKAIINNKSYLNLKYNPVFVNKFFLVVYNCDKPMIHDVLIREKDYQKYNLIFPDSLRWVCNYIN